ncbi:MAG: hypothetical protein QM768_09905 [Agriterribacter sp.]
MKQIIVLVFVFGGCIQQEHLPRAPSSGPPLLEIYTTGLPAIEHGTVANIIARRYGFRYRAIAGCVVTKEVSDRKYLNNRSVYSKLDSIWGYNWRDKFDMQVDSAIEINNKIEWLVNDEAYIRKANETFYKHGYCFSYHISAAINSMDFFVDVYIPPISKTDSTCLIYYKLKVDIQHKAVVILNAKKRIVHYSFFDEQQL